MVVGIFLATFSAVESYSEEEVLTKWDDIWPSTLNAPPNPRNSTFWGSYVPRGAWVELDLSFSGSLRVTVSGVQQTGQTTTPIFDELGVFFDDKVAVSGGGTYQVDIKNEGSSSVDIDPGSSVAVKQNVGEYRASNPYLVPGTLTACVGVVVLVVGFVTKPGRARRKKSAVKS